MKRVLIPLLLILAAPAAAQDDATPDQGLSLMERGAQMLMEGLLREMEPALEDLQGMAEDVGPALRDFAQQMGPALRGLLDDVQDWSVYEPPEMLDNGDIIIRRKPAPDPAPVPSPPGAEIEI
ncbi:hypothetical protein [uncultured Tateyamaria sp.]|uniref:hypothetical protein n=1 Tax=uncultured Tateyamaria sp. TaxID=455651 RepID=UPI002623EF87|nr:hypothetical protein [uncultured Tateyamaria sp.]